MRMQTEERSFCRELDRALRTRTLTPDTRALLQRAYEDACAPVPGTVLGRRLQAGRTRAGRPLVDGLPGVISCTGLPTTVDDAVIMAVRAEVLRVLR